MRVESVVRLASGAWRKLDLTDPNVRALIGEWGEALTAPLYEQELSGTYL